MNIQTKGLRIENLKRETWKDLFFITITLTLVSSVGHASTIKPVKIISPLAHQVYASDTVTSNKPSQHDEIAQYIKEVFGTASSDALKIAQCESHLNPRAINDNTQWGGVGVDRGIFQLNSVYQKVDNVDFLYDYHLNVLMAKKIFDAWGGNFNAWSCRKVLN